MAPSDLSRLFRDFQPPTFRSPAEVTSAQTALARLDTVLIDRTSWPEYGDPSDRRPGCTSELNDRLAEIVGDFEIGTGFGYNGLLLTSEESFQRYTPMPANQVTFGLIQLRAGADAPQSRDQLKRRLPDDVKVLTRAEFNQAEEKFWVRSTALGQIFTMGVAVAFLVGGIFVYQMMAGDIRNHLSEYATFKAMGYRGPFLSQIIIYQAILLALVGFGPGLLISLGLYELTRHAAHIPIGMTATRAAMVLGLAVVMCLCSGLLAVRKVHSSNPADLF
jgi:putative ABC transport system permease protein